MLPIRFGQTHFIPVKNEAARIKILSQLATLHLSKGTKADLRPDALASDDILVIDTRPDKPIKLLMCEAPILIVAEDDVEIRVFSNTVNPTYQMSPTEDDKKLRHTFSPIEGYTVDDRSSLNAKQLLDIVKHLKRKYLPK